MVTRVRTALVIVVALLIAIFFFVNWSVLAAPAKFSLLVASAEIPIGVVMLVLLGVAIGVVVVYAGLWHRSLLIDYGRQTKELHAQRLLADSAEASRFTEIGTLLRAEMAALTVRLDTSFGALREEVRNTENSLAASLGEMDDRIQRRPPGTPLP